MTSLGTPSQSGGTSINTYVVFQLYAALVAGTCAAALLCFSLPGTYLAFIPIMILRPHDNKYIYTEFLPGKRALAIALCLYHVTCSTILYNAPRVIPYSFGPFAESFVSVPILLNYCDTDTWTPGIASSRRRYGGHSMGVLDWGLQFGGKLRSC